MAQSLMLKLGKFIDTLGTVNGYRTPTPGNSDVSLLAWRWCLLKFSEGRIKKQLKAVETDLVKHVKDSEWKPEPGQEAMVFTDANCTIMAKTNANGASRIDETALVNALTKKTKMTVDEAQAFVDDCKKTGTPSTSRTPTIVV